MFSGGKALCGPQSSGLIIGRKELIEACALNSSPNVNCIGRGMKAGKEEIMGLLKAVELYTIRNHSADLQLWEDRVSYLAVTLKRIKGLRITRGQHNGIGDHAPFAALTWDINDLPISLPDFADHLLSGNPPIAVRLLNSSPHSEIRLHVHTLKESEEMIIAERILEIFNQFISIS